MTPWLSIIGLGEEGPEGLSPAARELLAKARVLVGGTRHLAMIPDDGRERLAWPSPLNALVDDILARRGTPVCVLATGDPMHYGIGVTLAKRVPIEEMTIIPAPSAFALACARLGWPMAEIEALTLHGRPIDLVNAAIRPGAKLVILGNDAATPGEVAARLRARGYGTSAMSVFEHMGGAHERRVDATAETWADAPVADFNTIAVACAAGPDAPALSRVPGLPDTAYESDGQLTKREVRAVTLAALAPMPGQMLWDIGAGCGSIAIEWLRAAPGSRAVAVERDSARRTLISTNAAALGVPLLEIIPGVAPGALAGLPTPDAVFIGGGLMEDGLFETCWRALAPGGRMVANAVTVEGESRLGRWRAETGGELARIAIARAAPVGERLGWRALMPVTQLRALKR